MTDINYPVATTMLVSVAEFREFAMIEGSEYDYLNTKIMRQISGNTYRLWKRLGGDPTKQYHNEYYPIEDYDQDRVVANHTPVLAVAAMTIHVPGVSDTAIASSDIWFDQFQLGVAARFSRGIGGQYQTQTFFGRGQVRLHVCYEAGYELARMEDLKLAINAETAAWLNRSGKEAVAKSREGSAAYEYEPNGWCSQANAIIQEWGS